MAATFPLEASQEACDRSVGGKLGKLVLIT
jgi:hypothetical protein